jgi:thiamine pyrophosphate-dependent acetolactate synthase large subunit-like protein
VSINDVASIPEIIYDAFQCANTWPYGAVHIECSFFFLLFFPQSYRCHRLLTRSFRLVPKNIASADVDWKSDAYQPFPKLTAPLPSTPSEPELKQLWGEISAAKAPIFIVGPDIWRDSDKDNYKARDQFREFCDRTNIGVVMIPGGKGAVDPTKPYCLYTVSLIFPDYPNPAITEADLVITVGYDPAEYDTSMWSSSTLATKIIHISATLPIVEALYKPKARSPALYLDVLHNIN